MKRILLVDDEEELLSALSERLALRGFEVGFALDGEQALARLEACGFDLAVLDVKMPGLGGLDLMRRMERICPGMKYIFLTGHGSENDYRLCREAGVCGYLMKPVAIETLVEQIHAALGGG